MAKVFIRGGNKINNVEVGLVDDNKIGINVTVDQDKSAWLPMSISACGELIELLVRCQNQAIRKDIDHCKKIDNNCKCV